MDNWHNTDELDELLGRELDLDQAWSEFKKEKKPTRRIPFWWCFGLGSILLLGVVGYFGNYINLKMNGQETAANLLHPSTAVPSFETSSSKKEKQATTSKENTTSSNRTKLNKSKAKAERIPSIQKRNPSIVQTPDLERKSQLVEQDRGVVIDNTENNTPLKEEALINNTELEVTTIASLQSFLFHDKIERIPVPEQTPPPTLNSKKWNIGIQYTLANAHRNISGGQEEYTQRRQEEEFLESNRIELLVSRNLSTHLFFQTGLSLNQYRSKLMEDIQTITSPVRYEDVITETHTQNNITQEIRGIAEGSQLAINRFTRYQKYQTLSIPLRIGVRVPLSPSWSIAASSGISFSLYGQTKGLTIASAVPDGNYIPLSQLGYKKVGVLEGMGQLSIERSFGNTTLNLGIQGAFDLNNRIKTTTSGMDKFRSYGLHFGIQRSF